jgi:hypothetical protein
MGGILRIAIQKKYEKMNERSLLKILPKPRKTFRYFAVLADHFGKKGKKQEYYKSIDGVGENMMDGTHISSKDLNLAREKARGGNTEHKFKFTLQGKGLLRGFFNRDKMEVFVHLLACTSPTHELPCASYQCVPAISSESVSETNNLKNYSFIVTFT